MNIAIIIQRIFFYGFILFNRATRLSAQTQEDGEARFKLSKLNGERSQLVQKIIWIRNLHLFQYDL